MSFYLCHIDVSPSCFPRSNNSAFGTKLLWSWLLRCCYSCVNPVKLTMPEQHSSMTTLKPRCRKSAVEKPFMGFGTLERLLAANCSKTLLSHRSEQRCNKLMKRGHRSIWGTVLDWSYRKIPYAFDETHMLITRLSSTSYGAIISSIFNKPGG